MLVLINLKSFIFPFFNANLKLFFYFKQRSFAWLSTKFPSSWGLIFLHLGLFKHLLFLSLLLLYQVNLDKNKIGYTHESGHTLFNKICRNFYLILYDIQYFLLPGPNFYNVLLK